MRQLSVSYLREKDMHKQLWKLVVNNLSNTYKDESLLKIREIKN